MRAVVSIVGKYTDTYTKTDEANPDYGYLRWIDIHTLIPEGVIEFQNHTYDLHSKGSGRKGAAKKFRESKEKYQEVLRKDLRKMQNEFRDNCYYLPNTFTYPFGAVSKDSKEVIKELGFRASLSSVARDNYITRDPECLYLLKRYNRDGRKSTEEIFKFIF